MALSLVASRTPASRAAQPVQRQNAVDRLRGAAGGILTGQGTRERLQRDAVLAFAVRVAGAGLLYLSQVLLARWLGGHAYGVYVSVWTMVLVLGGLAHGGLNLGMIRLLPEHRARAEGDLVRGLLTGGRILALAGGTIVAITGMGLLTLAPGLVGPDYAGPMMIALACVPFYALTDVQDGIGRGQGWMGLALMPPYVVRPLALIVAIAALAHAGAPLDAGTACAGAILATALTALVQTALINRRLARTARPGPARFALQRWMAVSAPLLVIAGAEIVLQNADILAVSRYAGAKEAGLYFASAKTMSLIMFVHYAVGSAVANRFATLHTRNNPAALQAFVRDAVHWTFWPSLAGAGVILALGLPLLSLFGPEFVAGYPVMVVLVVGMLVRAATGPAEFLLNMMGQQRLCAGALLAGAGLDVALNIVLVPEFGTLGAAMATSAALIAVALLNITSARRALGLRIAIWQNL